jgi:hypothetical protein
MAMLLVVIDDITMNALFDQEAKHPQRATVGSSYWQWLASDYYNCKASTITMGRYHAKNFSLVSA